MPVNLSRRSILGSLAFHVILVGGGIFLWNTTISDPPPHRLESGLPVTKVVSRPVKVKPKPKPLVAANLPGPTMVEKQSGSAAQGSQPVEKKSTDKSVKSVSPPKKQAVASSQAYPKAKPVSPRPGPKKPNKSSGKPKAPKEQFSNEPPGWGQPAPKPSQPVGGGEGGTQSKVTRRAMPVSQPEFDLTARFPELKSVKVKAEFKIKKDGSYEPTLLSGSGNPTADVVILAKLLEYKWLPAMEKGVPVEDTRVLQIRLDG